MPATVWKALPTVLTAEEILDKGFSRGSAAGAHVIDGNRMFRNRKQMSRMVQASSEVIDSTLRNYVSKWPSLDQKSAFDVALIDAAVGVDDYRHSLGTLQWAAGQVMRIANQNRKKLRRMVEIDSMHRTRREAYGRISSIVNQVGQQLDWLNHARDTLKVLPSIDSSEPCIVVAGAPNVGKSALIAALSPAEPVVAAYPFMKRITWWPQAWLGMVFTWGLLVGWTQLRADNLDALAAMYAGAALWVIGYDTIYAMQDREDDALVGIRSSALRMGTKVRGGVAFCYAAAVALWALAFWLYRADWVALLALLPAAGHLLWQVATLDGEAPGNPLDRFRANRWTGALVAAACFVVGNA